MSNREPITVDLGDLQDRVDARVNSGAYFPGGKKIAVGRGYSTTTIVQEPFAPPPGFGVLNVYERK